MRATWTMVALFGVWASMPACGGVAVGVHDDCGANSCGACAPGTTNQDSCSNGKWSCACVPTTSQCTAAPVCSKSEVQYATESACRKSGAATCRTQSMCGVSLWCGTNAAQCDGRPDCDGDDTQLTSQADCPPGGGCYPRSMCGETIWCSGGGGITPVWPPKAETLVAVDEGGGFVPSPPPGSVCTIGAARYTFTRASRNLAWELCNSNITPYALKKGSRVLSSVEASDVDAVMANVTVLANSNSCGADKPAMWISVTTPTETKKYWDSFYACNKQGTYVDNIDAVFSELGSFVK